MQLPPSISNRRLVAAVTPLAVLAVVAATPQLAGRHLASAWDGLADASPSWLWLALACFLGAVLSTALSWRAALAAAGARIGRLDTATGYGVGCLVNSFVPGGVGDAVRVAVLSQRLREPHRLWLTGGAAAAGALLRGVTFALLVLVASLVGALPLWPAFLIWGGSAATLAVASAIARRHPDGRAGRFLSAFTALLRSPRAAAAVVGWSLAAQAFRLGAATAAAAALAVPHPLLAALVIVPALQLATVLPLTPGNVGVASGAVALALQTRGVGVGQALAAGIAFHAAETVVGVAFGAACTLALVEVPSLVRRFAAATAAVALAVGLGVTVLDLV